MDVKRLRQDAANRNQIWTVLMRILQKSGSVPVTAAVFAFAMVAFTTSFAPVANAQNGIIESLWGNFDDDEEGGVEEEYNRPKRSLRRFVRSYNANPEPGYPTVSPGATARLREAIRRYSRIVTDGGWRQMPLIKLEEGDNHKAVQLLRYRLQRTGDLPARSGYSAKFDKTVTQGLKYFQKRHGLTPTGLLDKVTVMALNVPAGTRLQQLRTNMVRLRDFERSMPNRYVLVNIPSAQVEAVEGGRIVSRHSGVVGKVDRQTPIIQSKIHEINFNPYWTVPKSIVRKDLVPKAFEYAKSGKDIMQVYRMNAFDLKGQWLDPRRINWNSPTLENEVIFRQDPWKENSMGFVKINFENDHAVFMHDTPSKGLFGRSVRAESSGCIRVQNVEQLVSWILRGNYDWNQTRIQDVKQTGERIDVPVAEPTPVFFKYITAWVADDGIVNFRRDLYRRDNVDTAASSY